MKLSYKHTGAALGGLALATTLSATDTPTEYTLDFETQTPYETIANFAPVTLGGVTVNMGSTLVNTYYQHFVTWGGAGSGVRLMLGQFEPASGEVTFTFSQPVNLVSVDVGTWATASACTAMATTDQSGLAYIDFASGTQDLSSLTNVSTLTLSNAYCNERAGFAYESLDNLIFTVAPTTAPEIDVQGNAQSIASGDTTPSTGDHTDFGTADYSTSQTVVRTFTIANTGDDNLLFSGNPVVAISGSSAFSVTTQPTLSPLIRGSNRIAYSGYIPASEERTFQITFAPTQAGEQSATVTILSDDEDEGSYTFSVTGTGIGDSDGVSYEDESVVPGVDGSQAGDGNNDGTPDNGQDNVTSGTFSHNGGTAYFTLGSSSGESMDVTNVTVTQAAAPDDLPSDISMPYGVFSFSVANLPQNGATVDLELFVPYNPDIAGYYKYNNVTEQWDELSGVTVTHYPSDNKTKIEFSLTDGGPYDDDRQADGVLTDDGGPFMRAAPIAVPLFGFPGALLLSALLGLIGYRRLK